MKKLSERSAAGNLGTDRLVSINDLVDIVARIADKRIRKRYDLTKPQGVRGRNSDNTRLRQVLGWEPQTPLGEGLRITYEWIRGELIQGGKLKPAQAAALSAEQSCGAATSSSFGWRCDTQLAANLRGEAVVNLGMTGHRSARTSFRMHADGMPSALTFQPTATALKMLE